MERDNSFPSDDLPAKARVSQHGAVRVLAVDEAEVRFLDSAGVDLVGPKLDRLDLRKV